MCDRACTPEVWWVSSDAWPSRKRPILLAPGALSATTCYAPSCPSLHVLPQSIKSDEDTESAQEPRNELLEARGNMVAPPAGTGWVGCTATASGKHMPWLVSQVGPFSGVDRCDHHSCEVFPPPSASSVVRSQAEAASATASLPQLLGVTLESQTRRLYSASSLLGLPCTSSLKGQSWAQLGS